MALVVFASKFSKPACGRCLFCFELCHKMSSGQAEEVLRAILMILNRFSSDLGALGLAFQIFASIMETGYSRVGAYSGPGRAIAWSISSLVVCAWAIVEFLVGTINGTII